MWWRPNPDPGNVVGSHHAFSPGARRVVCRKACKTYSTSSSLPGLQRAGLGSNPRAHGQELRESQHPLQPFLHSSAGKLTSTYLLGSWASPTGISHLGGRLRTLDCLSPNNGSPIGGDTLHFSHSLLIASLIKPAAKGRRSIYTWQDTLATFCEPSVFTVPI